jgi:hypothetical protein
MEKDVFRLTTFDTHLLCFVGHRIWVAYTNSLFYIYKTISYMGILNMLSTPHLALSESVMMSPLPSPALPYILCILSPLIAIMLYVPPFSSRFWLYLVL